MKIIRNLLLVFFTLGAIILFLPLFLIMLFLLRQKLRRWQKIYFQVPFAEPTPHSPPMETIEETSYEEIK